MIYNLVACTIYHINTYYTILYCPTTIAFFSVHLYFSICVLDCKRLNGRKPIKIAHLSQCLTSVFASFFFILHYNFKLHTLVFKKCVKTTFLVLIHRLNISSTTISNNILSLPFEIAPIQSKCQ